MAVHTIEVSCQICGTKYHSDSEHVGKYLRCRTCGAVVAIVNRSQVTDHIQVETPRSAFSIKRRKYRHGLVAATVLFVAVSFWVALSLHEPKAEPNPETEREEVPAASPPEQSPAPMTGPVAAQPVSSTPRSTFFTSDQPCSPAAVYQRPLNGAKISDDVGTEGLGELTIDNGTNQDAFAKLQHSGTDELARSVYVRANRKTIVHSIEPGQYRLLYSFGYDWDEKTLEFRVCPSYHEFGKALSYTAHKDAFDAVSVTLHPVAFGNTKSRTITRDEFLKTRHSNLNLNP